MTIRAAPPARSGATSDKARWALFAIVLLAIVLRVGAIVYTHATANAPEENRLIAANLAAGRGFTFTEFGVTGPTAIRGPVYPMLLAIVGPDRVGLILAINVLAGAGSVLAAALLTVTLLSPLPVPPGRAREGAFSPLDNSSTADPLPNPLPEYRARGQEPSPPPMPRAAWIAAILFAIWPTQLYAATLTQGLSIAVFLTLASLALAWRRIPIATIAAGLLAGLAALTEPVLAPPLLLAAIVLGWRRHWTNAALFVATAMIFIAPWLYRNAVIFGGPMPITSNFWKDAFLGNGEEMRGNGMDFKDHLDANLNAVRQRTTRISRLSPRDFDQLKVPEAKRTLVFRQWALAAIEADPWHYASLSLGRLLGLGFGRFDHPLAAHWLYGMSFCLQSLWIWQLLIAPTRKFLVRFSVVVLFLVGLSLPAALTRGDVRLSVLRDVPMLLATAIAVQSVAVKEKNA